MANGRFTVCARAHGVTSGTIPICADCGHAITIDGDSDKGMTYICEDCLPARMADDSPDEVNVTIGGDDGPKPQDTLEAARACTETQNPNCGCGWCLVVNPIAADLAGVLKKYPGASKLARVEALVRILGEAAVVYQGHAWHRDAAWTTGFVTQRLTALADREMEAFYDSVRPKIEQAMREAGIDLSELTRSVKESLH